MRIVKTERIILSEAESAAWDLMVTCLAEIIKTTNDPDILAHTNKVFDGLDDLADYLEEED